MEIISRTIYSALVVVTLLGISSCSPSKSEQCASIRKIIDRPGKDHQTDSYYLNESKAAKQAYEKLNLPDKDLDRIRKGLIEYEKTRIKDREELMAVLENAKSIENKFRRLEYEGTGLLESHKKLMKSLDNHSKLNDEFDSLCPLSR